MKKLFIVVILLLSLSLLFFTKKGKVIKSTALYYVLTSDYINKEGNSLATCILIPDGFMRANYESGTFPKYLQNNVLKNHGGKVD